MRQLFVVAILTITGASFGYSQETTATLYGIITDQSGAVVPAARVTVTHEQTGASTAKLTDAEGEFGFDFLRAGAYTLKIEAAGFKTYSTRGLELAPSQRSRLTFVLEIGGVTETVEVVAQTPQLNAVSVEQRQSLSRQDIAQLPIAQRNFDSILAIGTGVQTTADGGVRLNGLGRSGVKVTVDGTDASSNPENPGTALKNNFNFIHVMSIEAIQEVETIKGITPAEYGQQLSGTVNLLAKSGTNVWHGSLLENFKADDLNAADRRLQRRPPFTFNQFGGSLGGPIRRDRIFIFGTYEGYRQASYSTLQGDVPTPKLRAEAIAAVPAYKAFLDTFYLPNQPYAATADTARFLGAGPEKRHENHAVVKGDIRIRDNGNLAVTYTRSRPFYVTPTGRVQIPNTRTFQGWQERGTVNYMTASAHWASETRFGYNYNDTQRVDDYWYAASGVSEDTPGGRRAPSFSVTGLFGEGGGAEFINNYGPVWSLEEKVAHTIGAHSFKFGGILNRRKPGRFDINNVILSYANKADFLANIPNSTAATFGTNRYTGRSVELGFFIQDNWRVRPNLVLNLGLRYDFFGKFVADPEDPKAPAGIFNPDGLLDSQFHFGPFRDPHDPFHNDGWSNFGPRVGFSYSPDKKTVVRAGVSVMFGPQAWDDYNRAVSVSTKIPFRVTFSRSDAIAQGIHFPTYNDDLRSLVERSSVQQIANAFDPNIQNPYTVQFYLGAQRSLTPTLMMESAYVGNRGIKFRLGRVFNWPDRVTDIRPNPALGQGNYFCSCQSTVYNSWQTSLRKQYSRNLSFGAHFTWGKALSITGGDNGADFSGDTINSVQDFFNPKASRGPSTGDVKYQFAGDWVYELPMPATSAVLRHAFGGWQISGVFFARTGLPVNLSQSGLTTRPDYVGGNPINPNWAQDGIYLNLAAFARVPLGSGGNPIRPGSLGNGAIRGTAFWNMDTSLGKNFRVAERMSLQIRADLFNLFNHTGYSDFTTGITSSTFGRFTGFYPARQMQLNARLAF